MSSSLAAPDAVGSSVSLSSLRGRVACERGGAASLVYWSAGRLRGFHGSPDGAARTRRGDGVAVSWIAALLGEVLFRSLVSIT